MRHSTGAMTISQKRRLLHIKDIGCITCLAAGRVGVYAELHHLLSGNRRRGHDESVGLCPWCHRGKPPDGMTCAQAEAVLGPSLARSSRRFHERYGSDDELLERQNELIRIEMSSYIR